MDTNSQNIFSLDEAFSIAKSEILEWQNNSNYVGIDDGGDFEITAYSTKHAAQVNVRKLDFLFVIFQLERKKFHYILNEFQSINQIQFLIQSFLMGKYSFTMGIENIPSSISWDNIELTSLDRQFSDIIPTDVRQMRGYEW
jgi:hypothetical protein